MEIALAIESCVKHMWVKWKRRFLSPASFSRGWDEGEVRLFLFCFFIVFFAKTFTLSLLEVQNCASSSLETIMIAIDYSIDYWRLSVLIVASGNILTIKLQHRLLNSPKKCYYERSKTLIVHDYTLTSIKVLDITVNKYYASKKNHILRKISSE